MNPIEAMAKAIYSKWDKLPGWVPWVDHGNSNMQELARDCARVAIDALADNVSTGMTRAASESQAIDDEGPFVPLADLLDFSGENKRHTVLKEGIAAAIRAAGEE